MHAGALHALPATVVLLALALAAPSALAEPHEREGAGGGEPQADSRVPPIDQLAPYLERAIPPSADASQWLAENAAFLPQEYRDRLLAEHPSLAARGGSAQPPDGGAEPAVSGSSSGSLPDPADIFYGETFAYGWLRSAQPDGSIRAQAGATVCLADRTPAGAFKTLRHVVTDEPACQVTGGDGYFGGHIFIDNDDGDPVRLWLNASAAGPHATIVDGAGQTYAVRVNATDDLGGYITRLGNADVGAAEDVRKALWILDAVSLGRETVRNATGRDAPHVDVRWLNDAGSAVPSSYDPSGMSMTVASGVKRGASHGAEAYPASILHEYGHHVMRTAYAAAGSAYPGGGQCTAGIARAASDACAWADGWAYFFPSLALGESLARYHDHRYPLDLEPAKWRLRGTSSGSSFAGGSAGQVASALWDIHDGAGGEAGDTVGNATAGIWSALYGARGPGEAYTAASFGDFAADWRGGGRPPLESIMVLNGLDTVQALLLSTNGSAAGFADGLENGSGSWIMSGGGNWRVAPASGPGGSAALVSSGCGTGRGCEATAVAAVNASGYVRTAFNFSLAGGPLSVLHVQHSADGSSWASAASYNGSVAGWREAAVDAVRVEGGGHAYLRLVATSPSQNHSAAVVDVVFRPDSSPVMGAVQGMRVGEGRTAAVNASASDPDGDAASLSLAFSPVDDVRGSMITPNGSAGLLPEDAGRAESVWVALDDAGDGRGVVKATAALAGAGNFTAVLTATAHGLSDSVPVRIRVDDVMPPVIASNGTADMSAEAAHYAGTSVGLPPVLVADNYDPSPSLAHNRSSSGLYPLGTAVVVYSAADSSGNTASASQLIAVSDTVPPAIEGVPGDIAMHRLRGGAPAVADYALPTATDLGRGVPVECTPPPGAELGWGTTAVSCKAVDGGGNRRDASFDIAVAFPPILYGPSSPVPASSLSSRVQGGMTPNPRGIDTAEVDGSTYAVVAFSRPEWWYLDGVQIVNVTDPHRAEHVSLAVDGRGGFDRLGGAVDVAVVPPVGGAAEGAYVAAVSPRDGGIQVVNITDPASPSPASSLAAGGGGSTYGPGQPGGIAAFEAGGSAYVIAAMPGGAGGVYIANVTDPARPALVSSATDGAAGFDELAGASGVAVAEIGGSTYAVVASSSDSGIQIVNITDPARPAAVSSATDGASGFDELAGASGVAVAEIGGSTYAVVASSSDSGIQIVNITNPSLPTPVSSATDGASGFARLSGASDVAVAGIGASTYAVVASMWDHGVQVVNITNPASPAPAAALSDGASGFDEMYTASGVATAVIGPALYALVTSFYDDGLQVIGIEAAGPNLPPRMPPIPDMVVTETGRLRHDARASDPNGDRLSVAASAVPPAPGLAASGNGMIEWVPGESQSGSYAVTVTATDSHGAAANRTFTLTVRNASIHAVPASTFSSSLDGWSYKHVTHARATAMYCGWGSADNVQYALSRSTEHGGSAHLGYVNTCWFGDAGASKNVGIPAEHGGGDMRIDLEYRTRANTYSNVVGTNNLHVIVSDSEGRVLHWERLYTNERTPGQGDSGWRDATVYAKAVPASACPCEVFVYTIDDWRMHTEQQFYLDNVNISVARPAASPPSGAASGSSDSAPAPARNSLTVDELFAMTSSNGTRVVITEKIIDGTSVSLGWSEHGGARAYDVAVAPAPAAGFPGDESGWAVNAVGGTSYRIDGLDPYSIYEVRVGVRGDPSTQSSVRVDTGG